MILSKNATNTVIYKGKELKIQDAFVNAAYSIDFGPLTENAVDYYLSKFEEDVIENATIEQLVFALEYAIRDEFICLHSEDAWHFLEDDLVKDLTEGKYLNNGEFVIIRDGKVIKHPAPKVVKPTGFCDCPHCLAKTPYSLQKKEFTTSKNISSNVIHYFAPVPVCQKCDSESYVIGARGMFLEALTKAYKTIE